MKVSQEAQQMIDASAHKNQLEEMIAYTNQLMKEYNIEATELQWTILINHLNEMIRREKSQERIPQVDPEMFAEVSAEALSIAEAVTRKIGELPIDEKYVLSIHFESAKQN
ncbi:PRD domain-containing protein [Candidatus Enterococcus willemsii]|uniref:Transcriptional antiterminator n=1 Tax=Candidatus Enterococcus willemsii TaxID=1857215 RepID=A0ABQ6YXG6_9ENTE|nr:PRD domain-containing protein [Enterococcus sp. CU12B]KAF1302577.1 transcriptional antiterminator [Enterococcus sp. CU12B]